MNTKFYIFFITFIAFGFSFGQEKNLDQLEMFYDQGHYKVVLRRANKLIDNPDYDYTVVPKFYKSMALFQMNQNQKYRKRNKNSLNEAISLWEQFMKEDVGRRVFDAHIHEIIELKQDLVLWKIDLQKIKEEEIAQSVSNFLRTYFNHVDDIETEGLAVTDVPVENNSGSETKKDKTRKDLIEYAKTLKGIKYKYGGIDKKGFDCSGFTSHVFKEFEVELPRRAADQHVKSKKKKIKDAQAGDLVFFSSGGGVNHVGIIVSNKNGKPIMIHASTSQGIVETDIMSNSYWKPRLKFCGTYLD